MKAIAKGDWEGFFAFGLDAMLAFILMNKLCRDFLGFSEQLLFTRILPAAAVGLIIGNLFYARQALLLAKRENRSDVCAIPYGTSTITIIIYVFLVMFPTQQKALGLGMEKEAADIIAWHTGILACMVSGLIEFFGSFVVHWIRRVTPRVVMLVAIAGTGVTFISMDYVFRTYAYPLLGFVSLALVLVFYFGGMKSKGGIPGGVIIIAVGTLLAWGLHWFGFQSVVPSSEFSLEFLGFHLPSLEVFQVFSSISLIIEFLPIIIPFGFVLLIGSLQNIEAAAAAGDSYEPKPMLMMNGLGSLGAACFGSPFPTSIFLGHSGYKKIGARAGYSSINAVVWTVVCITGTVSILAYAIPIEAIMPILIFIGVAVCAQSFEIADRKHMPAIVLGITPALAAYVAAAVKHTLSVAGANTNTNLFTQSITADFVAMRAFYADGMFALGQGFIYTCMVLAAVTYYVIENRFRHAAAWSLVGAVMSVIGFTHSYAFIAGDVIGQLAIEWSKWTTGYVAMAAVFYLTPWLTRSSTDHRGKTGKEV